MLILSFGAPCASLYLLCSSSISSVYSPPQCGPGPPSKAFLVVVEMELAVAAVVVAAAAVVVAVDGSAGVVADEVSWATCLTEKAAFKISERRKE